MSSLRRAIVVAVVVVIACCLVLANGTDGGGEFITERVTAGSLAAIVTAAGNLRPRRQMDIGSEVSGLVGKVNVDTNDNVKVGEVLAVLDTSRLKAKVAYAESALVAAEARAMQKGAELRQAHSNLARVRRLREVSNLKLPSQADMDAIEAEVARSEADASVSRSAIDHARANLAAALMDLSKAEIRSPIDGVVLMRSVDQGQTIAASLQSPVLFTLAEDLREIELHVAVDEADIDRMRVGQRGTFSVDAYPEQEFSATVTRVHIAPISLHGGLEAGGVSPAPQSDEASNSVVSYRLVLAVDNPDLLLRPGMTATVRIVTSSINDAILVSNAAMNFTPKGVPLPGMPDELRGSGISLLLPYIPDRWKCPREDGRALGCVWLLERGQPVLAVFEPGAADDTHTQVLELGRLPGWYSLTWLRTDRILTAAIRRKIEPGMQVIIDTVEMRPE